MRHINRVLFVGSLSFAVLLALTASPALSQTITTGDVTGIATDSTHAVVPGASVTIRNADTNEARTVATGETGQYRFTLLKPGSYTISAQVGSLKSKQTSFTVAVGQQRVVDIVLDVQGTQEAITVTAQDALIQTENANLATTITQDQVKELPMPGGDLTTLAMTVPGVRVNVKGGSGNMNANGVPGSSMLFTLNGADVMDPYNNLNNSGASNNLLGSNEVAEAAVVLNAYSAQYGRMAGGQVNLIGKSGSNGFHGNLIYNYNGDILNANDFFNNVTHTPRARSVANQYAGSVGGPIRKDKTFFFFDTEGMRYVLPGSGVVSVPSPEFQQYTLAHVPATALPLYQAAFKLYNNAPGISRAVPVTNGTGLLQDGTNHLGCQTRGTFNGTYVNGASGPRFGYDVPCAYAFGTNTTQFNKESLIIARVDHNITDNQKINFRYEYDWGLQATGVSPIDPAFNSQSSQPQHQGQLGYTYVITPRLVNSAILQSSWYSAIFGVADFSKTSAMAPIRMSISDGGANGGGFASIGAGFPTGRNVGQLQVIDDLSWSRGTHTFKFGVNYRYNQITDTSIASSSQIGSYSFADLTDYVTGQVNSTGKGSSFSQAFPLLYAAHIRMYSLNFYLQDEWAASRSLKLTYGVRFERDGNPACVDNCFSRMNQQFGTSGYQGGAGVPYNQTITTGLHTAYAGLESIIPEPRFGVAFAPFGPDKMVFRGGIGLFANLFAGSVASSVFNNSPNKFTPSVTFGRVGLAAADPSSSQAAAIASFNAFVSGFSQGYTLTQIQAALGKIRFSPPGYYSPPQDFAAPKSLQWNFEIEQPLDRQDVLSVTYVGNHGYDQQLSNADANSFTANTTAYPGGYAGLPLAAPDPRFLTVTQVLTSGRSNYDGLTVQLRHAARYGLQGQIGYTWSHALGIVGVYNPYNLDAGYSSLSFDTRHALTSDLLWSPPWRLGRRPLDALISGWTLSNKLYLYSGSPFSVSNSQLAARINSGGGIGNTILADVKDMAIDGKQCSSQNMSPNPACFTAAQFATTSTQLDFGNVPPNSFRGTGYFNIDTQLTRKIRLTERAAFELGFSAYNLLNHANFSSPGGSVTSGSLGLIGSAVSPPTSIYGSFQGATVSGRVLVAVAKFNF